MTVLTGANGQLRFNGAPVAKVRRWSLNVAKGAQETTCLGVYDREYQPGLRGATGTADVLYDSSDSVTASVLNSIFTDQDEASDTMDFILSRTDNRAISAQGFVTGVTPSVGVGEVQASTVSFQITGKITGGF